MQAGDVIADRFELVAPRGQGGMGTIWEARDRETGERVALKQMLDLEAGDAPRFLREARVLSELSHPAIVRYVAHGVGGKGAWLAMAWLEGEDLASRLDRQPLSLREAISLGVRIGEALGVAHARGIVHRDVKPANVLLVDGDPRKAVLLDFGIARRRYATSLGADPTRVGVLLGTPGYMAPEQARGERDVDARADVFSLGCVLFECLTDRPVFVGAHPIAVLSKVLMEEAPPVEELAPTVPPGVAAIVDASLSKDRGGRPADGAALAAELRVELEHVGRDSLPGDGGDRPRASVPLFPSLSGSELEIVSVVMAKVARVDDAATVVGSSLDGRSDPHVEAAVALGRELAAADARVERLEGAIVVRVRAAGIATDQTAAAARIALALRAAHGEPPTVLATGRAPAGSRVPLGEAIDRASVLLAAPPTSEGVRVDAAAAGLLDARFVVTHDDVGAVVRHERTTDGEARTLLGKPTRCVGRERELSTLLATFDECVSECVARVVVVTAPPGMGKSRLRHELLARIASRGDDVTIWSARAEAVGAGSALGMLSSALRRAAGILDGEPLSIQRAKLAAQVAGHVDPALAGEVTLFLGELAGVRAPVEASPKLEVARRDAMLMVEHTRRAFDTFVAAEASAAPVVLVLDDLHWGDPATIGFVDAVLRNHPDLPFFVLAFARPELDDAFPDLWASRHPTRIALGPLGKKAAQDLVRGVLGARATPQVLERILARAEGNPFYLEELVRAAATGAEDVPESVLAMVQSRIEGLPAEARRVLRAASVLGLAFWRDAVATLLGGERRTTDLVDWLRYLVEQELVIEREPPRFAGQRELVFRHALVRDVAYRTLLPADRVLGHRLAGEWLVAAGEPDALTIARHFDEGQAPERARAAYLGAARQALEGHELAQTIARAERGIACGAEGEQLGELLLVVAEAHVWRGETTLGAERAERGRALVPRFGYAWLLAANLLANTLSKLAAEDRLVALAHELRDGSTDDPKRTGMLMATRANVAASLLNCGQQAEARALMRTVDEATTDPVAQARIAAAKAIDTRDPGERVALRRRAAEMWEVAGSSRAAWNQSVNVGHALIEVGQGAEAVAVLERALAQSLGAGLQVVASYARHNLGLALALVGRLDEGRTREEEAVVAFVQSEDRRGEGSARTYLGEILLATGEVGVALREAEHAVALLERFEPLLPRALAVLARARLLAGAKADARIAAERALSLVEQTEEGERAVRLVHAEALEACGEHEAARAAITKAEALLLARAADIADPALRRSFLEGVPENARTLALAAAWRG